jgi:ribosomal protein S18 acetylase RimI-like enzyme
MEIQALQPAAVEAAAQLWRDAGLTRPWNDPLDDLRRALAGPGSTVLAGAESGTLIATAMVGHDGHRGWVYYLAVSTEARGLGLGRQMMDACEAWLLDRGIPKLNIMVRGGNAAARGFYERLGYDLDDVVVLSRRLGANARQSPLSDGPARR